MAIFGDKGAIAESTESVIHLCDNSPAAVCDEWNVPLWWGRGPTTGLLGPFVNTDFGRITGHYWFFPGSFLVFRVIVLVNKTAFLDK